MDQDRTRKLAAIADLVQDVRLARAAGKEADDDAIMAVHPELMPELREELEKLRRVMGARKMAEAGVMIGPEGDETAGNLAEEMARPEIKVAGYSLLKEVNRGGQAVVYLAVQLSTGRKVALKVMREGPLADERALARFKREVQILAALNHPHIVTILDTGVTLDGSRYLAMNYIAGHSLDEYMKYWHKKDPNDPGKLLRLFLKICGAINTTHLRGIVHRDLKPSNIRIDERGEPHILDFGLARTGVDKLMGAGDRPVSITGEFLGSLPWSSPEQAEGDPAKIDPRTDVYALGVILYQMLTGGRFPYQVVGNIRDVLNNIIATEPTPPSQALRSVEIKHAERSDHRSGRPVVNEAIERVVMKALAKNREKRYQSAGEMGKDVANYLAGSPIDGRSQADGRRRFTGRVILLIAAVLAGGICAGYALKRAAPSSDDIQSAAIPMKNLPASTQAAPAIVQPSRVVALSTEHTTLAQTQATEPAKVATEDIPGTAQEYRGRHYLLLAGPVNWEEAERRCREMEGRLACPLTPEEQTFLQSLKGAEVTAWLGGKRNEQGTWTWNDGTNIEQAADGKLKSGNYDRLFMMRDGRLAARPNSGQIEGAAVPMVEGFICQGEFKLEAQHRAEDFGGGFVPQTFSGSIIQLRCHPGNLLDTHR